MKQMLKCAECMSDSSPGCTVEPREWKRENKLMLKGAMCRASSRTTGPEQLNEELYKDSREMSLYAQ